MSLYTGWPQYSNGEPMKRCDWVKTDSPFGPIEHHGIIYAIVHNGSAYEVWIAHSTKNGGVVITPKSEFEGRTGTLLVRRALTPYHEQCMIGRIEANIGKRWYVDANCEHFASFVYFGKPESKQLQAVGSAALVALGVYGAVQLFGDQR
jgi:hypothetical protein